MTEDRYAHARQNAKAWAEELIDRWREDMGDVTDADHEDIVERCRELPLSVLVRGPWYDPTDHQRAAKPNEYEILLSTGGPALRIIGDLDNYGQPDNASLEMQDWGVPWRGANGMDIDYAELDAALLWFAGHFYYGE